MALKTNYPDPPPRPKEPQLKDELPKEHDTTSGSSYGTTEGVKPAGTSFEIPEVKTPQSEQEKKVEADRK